MATDTPGGTGNGNDGWRDELRRRTEENHDTHERLDRQYREAEEHLEGGELDRALDREFFVSEVGRLEAKVDQLTSDLAAIGPLVNELLRELLRLRGGGG